VAVTAGLGLLVLNRAVYRFFLRQRGPAFALASVLLHWLYYGYSAVAFGLGNLRHQWRRRFARSESPPSGAGATLARDPEDDAE